MQETGVATTRLDALLLRSLGAFENFDEEHVSRIKARLMQLRQSTIPLKTSLQHAHRLPGKTMAMSLIGFGKAEQARIFLGVLWGGLRAGFVHAGIRKDSSGWEAVLVFQMGENCELDEELVEEVCKAFPLSVARMCFDNVNDDQMMAALLRIENMEMFPEKIGNITVRKHRKTYDLLHRINLQASFGEVPSPPFAWNELNISAHANAVFRELINASLLSLNGLAENSRLPNNSLVHIRNIYGNLRQLEEWLRMQTTSDTVPDMGMSAFLWRIGLTHETRAPLLIVHSHTPHVSPDPRWDL